MGTTFSYLTGSNANGSEENVLDGNVNSAVTGTPQKKRKRDVDDVSSDEDTIATEQASPRLILFFF